MTPTVGILGTRLLGGRGCRGYSSFRAKLRSSYSRFINALWGNGYAKVQDSCIFGRILGAESPTARQNLRLTLQPAVLISGHRIVTDRSIARRLHILSRPRWSG